MYLIGILKEYVRLVGKTFTPKVQLNTILVHASLIPIILREYPNVSCAILANALFVVFLIAFIVLGLPNRKYYLELW